VDRLLVTGLKQARSVVNTLRLVKKCRRLQVT
jgi:hypothetical protein